MFEDLINKLRCDKYITLETTPTANPILSNILEQLETSGVCNYIDGFSTTDNPLANLKYNSILAGIKLQERFKKPVIATMSMRDRNQIALQSDLLGANDFDIRCILALTGDPAGISDQPNTKGVFVGSSIMLLDIIKCFNAGINYAGREFKYKPKRIHPFAVTNAFAKQSKHLVNKIYKKLDHGAIGLISQPVFDIGNAKELLGHFNEAKSKIKDCNSELIFGIFPITKFKTAQFLSSHVPGIYVPKEWIDKLYKASKISIEEEYKVGLELSSNLYDSILAIHPKMHIMTANHFNIAKEILSR
jgi:5,10-methylenetetrahydrofolate reductase